MNETQEEEDDDVDDEPSTPPVIVISGSPERWPLPPPQLRTPPALNPPNTYVRKSKSLQVNIEQPPSDELIRRVAEALGTPLPSSPRASPSQRRGSVSPTAPTQEDLPQEELSPPCERRTKLKHDQRPKKRPQGSWAELVAIGFHIIFPRIRMYIPTSNKLSFKNCYSASSSTYITRVVLSEFSFLTEFKFAGHLLLSK